MKATPGYPVRKTVGTARREESPAVRAYRLLRALRAVKPLDLSTRTDGAPVRKTVGHHSITMDGAPVQSLSAEGLILLKKDSLRPKDQFDVMALRDVLRRRGGA